MKPNFKTIGIIGKYNSAGLGQPLTRLADHLLAQGYEVLVTVHTADVCHLDGYRITTLHELGQQADVAIVMGGDGTLLNVARSLVDFSVPMIGVNQGRLGFLADVAMENMFVTLDAMLRGEYVHEDRILLDCHIERGEAHLLQTFAFNDVVVSKGPTGRLIEFEVYIDNQFVYSQRADGFAIASPTGSTAYALSAGGPILHPTLEAFVLVPICAHTLSARPIAVNSRSEIEVNLIHADDARAHFDGQRHQDLLVGDRVVIRRAGNTVRLLHPAEHNYYDTLRQKLHWGEKL